MKTERFRWLAGVIAAHPNRELVGRTRLQKEMWLLQRLGMPSEYDFRMHYFGPYSEGIQADVNLLERFQLVTERMGPTRQEGGYYSVFAASDTAVLNEIDKFQAQIDRLSAVDDVTILELAATYDMCRRANLPHPVALGFLKSKKGDKCSGGRQEKALALLGELGLPTE